MPSEYTTLFTSVQIGASTGPENVIKLKRILRRAAKMTEEYWKLIYDGKLKDLSLKPTMEM